MFGTTGIDQPSSDKSYAAGAVVRGGRLERYKGKYMNSMITAVFVTYNCLGKANEVANGWHEAGGRRALVLQNTCGVAWGASPVQTTDPSDIAHQKWDRQLATTEVDRLWRVLETTLSQVDRLIVYIGSSGSERAVELASTFDPDRVVYVGCDCGEARKIRLLGQVGYYNMRRCKCGGHHTMKRLFEEFLETGKIDGREVRPVAQTFLGAGI